MRPADFFMVALIGLVCAVAYAATKIEVGIDCGSLAGKGRVAILVDGQLYVKAIECGREA